MNYYLVNAFNNVILSLSLFLCNVLLLGNPLFYYFIWFPLISYIYNTSTIYCLLLNLIHFYYPSTIQTRDLTSLLIVIRFSLLFRNEIKRIIIKGKEDPKFYFSFIFKERLKWIILQNFIVISNEIIDKKLDFYVCMTVGCWNCFLNLNSKWFNVCLKLS